MDWDQLVQFVLADVVTDVAVAAVAVVVVVVVVVVAAAAAAAAVDAVASESCIVAFAVDCYPVP